MATSTMQRILDSLEHANARLDALQRREDRARADSEARAAESAERARYRQQMRDHDRMIDLQSRADDALAPWSIRAPQPSSSDDVRSYRLRLARIAARQLPPGHELRRIDLSICDDDFGDVVVPQIFNACRDAVNRVDTLAPGQMREIKEEKHGRRFSTFVGAESFVKSMMPEARRVVQFAKRDGTFREE
jgi:hypothetical protein